MVGNRINPTTTPACYRGGMEIKDPGPAYARRLMEVGETESEYEIWKAYKVSPHKTIAEWARATADDLGKAVATLQQMATRNRWRIRKTAYLTACAQLAAEDAQDQLETLGASQAALGMDLMRWAHDSALERIASGETLTPAEIKMLSDVGSKLANLSAGNATSIIRIPEIEEALSGASALDLVKKMAEGEKSS